MNPPSKRASQAILEQLDRLAKISVERQYAIQSEAWTAYNAAGMEKSLRDSKFHFTYLAESLAADDISLFFDYVNWVKVLFAGLHFRPDALGTTLDCMKRALLDTLPLDSTPAAVAYIDSVLESLPSMPDRVDTFLPAEAALHQLATDYLEALLRGDRHAATDLIMTAVASGVPIKEIYTQVFQPCQREVGRLWQTNQVSVAQEHFCTAATQSIISQLYPYIFATEKKGRRLVATSVGGELHELGVRMVADFFEMEGWDTYYLGANTPKESVLRYIEDNQADVLAVSATISMHISKVAELIEYVRANSTRAGLKILVGGYPFNIARGLWRQIGADGFAVSAQEAVRVAEDLLQEAG